MIVQETSAGECVWLDLNEVYRARCAGTCGEEMVYDRSHTPFDLDIEFDVSNETVAYTICDKYFGTSNDTKNSLQSMDILFEYILSQVCMRVVKFLDGGC